MTVTVNWLKKCSYLFFRFLYKPGDVAEAPKFCLPHQPRLDWQMWFAALGLLPSNPNVLIESVTSL